MEPKIFDGVKVILADDDIDNVDMVKPHLERLGCTVEVCHNGNEVTERLELFIPDVFILDVVMPEKDGYALCNELKVSEKYSRIPVILLSSVPDQVTSTRYSNQADEDSLADKFVIKSHGLMISLINVIKTLVNP